jgi:PAS domain S-box-containing protein
VATLGTTADPEQAFIAGLAPYLPPALRDINVPCYVLDRSGEVRWLNKAAKKVFGDVTGRRYTSLLDSDQAHRAHERFSDQLRGRVQPDVTVNVRCLDGRDARVEISSVPIRSDHRAIGVFGLATPAPSVPKKRAEHQLTPRQLQVLDRLGAGASTDQIAAELRLSRETVRNHIRHLLARLDARSRLEAVAIAHRDGLL